MFFIYLLSVDNWISLISAILIGGGTITLATMAYKTIRQTRYLQKNQYKHELLNDIYSWATELSNFNLVHGMNFQDTKNTNVKDLYAWSSAHWSSFLSSKDTKGESLKRRAEVMYPSIGSLIEDVLNKIKSTSLRIEKPTSIRSNRDVIRVIHSIGVCASALSESAEKAIEEIDKIKITP